MNPIIKKAIIVALALALVAGCKTKEKTAGGANDTLAPIAAADSASATPVTALSATTPLASASAATVTAAAPVAAAPHGPVHPAYLHALSDLRNARHNLLRKGGDPAMKWDEQVAIGAVDRAIREIKLAAIDDGKDITDHQPVDANLPPRGRLHKALASLQAARADINQEEDNAYAAGLKQKALHHINEAIGLTNEGIASLH